MNELYVKCALSAFAAAVLAASAVFTFFTGNDDSNAQTPPTSPIEVVLCPDGWTNTSDHALDHIQLSCSKGDYIVYLRADHSFDHGWNKTRGGDFIFDPDKVPEWH